MLPKKLPQYTVTDLERRASHFLAERYGGGLEIPIDVDFLLETLPNVDLDVWPNFRQNHQVIGITMRDPKTGTLFIKIDEQLADQEGNRYRMTVAEELGHVVLHRELANRIQSIDDFRELQNHPDYRFVERNAKRFAAAILMPGQLVISEAEEIYPQLVKRAGFGDVDAIKKYLCSVLAKRFEVSFAAMRIRLKEWPVRVDDRVDNSMNEQLEFLA